MPKRPRHVRRARTALLRSTASTPAEEIDRRRRVLLHLTTTGDTSLDPDHDTPLLLNAFSSQRAGILIQSNVTS